MSDPVLSRRRPGDLRLPAFPLPGGGSVRPSTMTDPAPDYGVTIDYVVDTDDLVFALGIFVRVEFRGEAAGFLADPAATLAAQVDGVAPAPPGLPGPLRSVAGPPGYRIDERVEDRIECTLEAPSNGLVFGAFATSADKALTRAAMDFAGTRIQPQFVDRP